jgi:uncharacterized protein (TIGR03086 family)
MNADAFLHRLVTETDRMVDAVRRDQLDLPTLCSEWSTRDLINHMVATYLMFAGAMRDGGISDQQMKQFMSDDHLGNDIAARYDAARTGIVVAFADPDAAARELEMPFGAATGRIALAIVAFEVTTHALDLAKAVDEKLQDATLVKAALVIGHEILQPEVRPFLAFDPEQPVPDDATAGDRLLAFTGRHL